MKRLWTLATGVAVMLCSAMGAAKAETVALNFEVATPPSQVTLSEVSSPQLSRPRMTPGQAQDPVGLSFDPMPMESMVRPSISTASTSANSTSVNSIPGTEVQNEVAIATVSPSIPSNYDLDTLFEGGVNSLVAVSVGNAEGTRTPTGGYTRFYNGHTDPGNQVWNLGTFSYQHGASSPEEADAKQLRRLLGQAQELRRQAAEKQMTLTVLEELNGIDLANQAPTTALDRGYIKWLERAKQTPMGEAERVVWARTRSFIHPDTGRWNAPGLGNTLESVTRDQRRRQQAISIVLEAQGKP